MTELLTKDAEGAAEGYELQAPASVWGRVRRASAGFWLKFMFWWAEHYPPAVIITRPFFLWFAWNFSAVLHNGTMANARRLLGAGASEKDCTALAKQVLRNFYLSVYELGRAVRMTHDQIMAAVDAVEGREHYEEARQQGKGAIVVTAHLGSFEVGMAALVARERHVHVVFQRDNFDRFDRLRSKLRVRLGVEEAPLDDGWALWVRLRDALAADHVVMIQADRVLPGRRGVPVAFLGGHILMPTGPIKLALATGAPLVPVFSIRTREGSVRIVIDEPITVSKDDGPPDHRHPAMRRLASVIARRVQKHPDQWLMVNPVWCEDFHDA